MQTRRTLPEQEELMGDFSDPFDFIYKFIEVYKKQTNCATKVLLSQIPYYRNFQCKCIERVMAICIEEPLSSISFDGVERALHEFRSESVYDEDFYECCTVALFKGYNVLLDRAANEVLDMDFENVSVLYRYSCLCIDVSGIVIDRALSSISTPEVLAKMIVELRRQVDTLNRSIRRTEICRLLGVDDAEPTRTTKEHGDGDEKVTMRFDKSVIAKSLEMVRVRIPPSILGSTRVLRYSYREILDTIFENFLRVQQRNTTEVFYFNVMSLCGELSSNEEFEAEIEDLKKIANERIDADTPK